MRVSDVWYRLMEWAQKEGVEQCTNSYRRKEMRAVYPSLENMVISSDGKTGTLDMTDCYREVTMVCAVGLVHEGRARGVIDRVESEWVLDALLQACRITADVGSGSPEARNDVDGWTFPDFYTALKEWEERQGGSEDREARANSEKHVMMASGE